MQEQRIRQALVSVSVVNWFSNHCRRHRICGCTQGARQAQNRQSTGCTSCVRRVPAVGRPAGRCMGKTVLPYTAEDAPAPLDVRTGCAERPKRILHLCFLLGSVRSVPRQDGQNRFLLSAPNPYSEVGAGCFLLPGVSCSGACRRHLRCGSRSALKNELRFHHHRSFPIKQKRTYLCFYAVICPLVDQYRFSFICTTRAGILPPGRFYSDKITLT